MVRFLICALQCENTVCLFQLLSVLLKTRCRDFITELWSSFLKIKSLYILWTTPIKAGGRASSWASCTFTLPKSKYIKLCSQAIIWLKFCMFCLCRSGKSVWSVQCEVLQLLTCYTSVKMKMKTVDFSPCLINYFCSYNQFRCSTILKGKGIMFKYHWIK